MGTSFWEMLETGMGIFLTLGVLGLILTHQGEFVAMIKQTGASVTSMFQAMTFQPQTA